MFTIVYRFPVCFRIKSETFSGDEPHECSSTRESEDIAKLKKHIEIVRKPEILQNIKDLEGEAHAMFLRSNVPESERPASCKGLEDVPVEVNFNHLKGVHSTFLNRV